MSDIDYPIVGHKEKSAICNHCKHDYTGNQLEVMCMDESNNCQMCHAALSGKFADGKSLMVGVDMVNHPPHYKDASGVGCTEVVKHMMFFGGSCFKYLYRCGNKWDDIGDLKKAVRCAEQARIDNEKVCWSAIIGINTVASHRNKNIGAAMNYISTEDWQWVIVSIRAEIARLESEQ